MEVKGNLVIVFIYFVGIIHFWVPDPKTMVFRICMHMTSFNVQTTGPILSKIYPNMRFGSKDIDTKINLKCYENQTLSQ